MWSEPIIKKDFTGREIAIFLMDSQGWHDDQTTFAENKLVFMLSTLPSSVMIFNVQRNVGEDDLAYLQNFMGDAKIWDKENNDELIKKRWT